jgi:hypothetical protein
MTNVLSIQVVETPQEAPNYNRDAIDVRGATISQVIIVKRGTVEGNPTVDFQFTDQQGAQYVAMLTGRLVQSLASVIAGADSSHPQLNKLRILSDWVDAAIESHQAKTKAYSSTNPMSYMFAGNLQAFHEMRKMLDELMV